MSWIGTTRLESHVPVDDSGLRINGQPLSDWHMWLRDTGVELADAQPATSTATIPGTYGAADLSALDAAGYIPTGLRDLTIHLVTTCDELEAPETMGGLAALNGSTVTVDWRLWPGSLHGTCSVGAWTEHRDVDGRFHGLTVDLTVTCDPLMDGDPLAFTIPTTGATVWIHGNRPSGPLVTTRPPSGTKRLYLTFDTRQLVFNHTFTGSQTLTVDCTGRKPVSRIGDSVILPTVDSDYPVLTPGLMSCSTSAGDMTVTYTPKWLI